MSITYSLFAHKIDLSDLGNKVVIPVSYFTSMTIQIEPNGGSRSSGVLTMKRGNNVAGEFQTWEGGAVTFTATGFYPSTEVYNVAGIGFVSLEVTTAESGVGWLVTVYLNDSLSLTKALT